MVGTLQSPPEAKPHRKSEQQYEEKASQEDGTLEECSGQLIHRLESRELTREQESLEANIRFQKIIKFSEKPQDDSCPSLTPNPLEDALTKDLHLSWYSGLLSFKGKV